MSEQSYKNAGVDIEAADNWLASLGQRVQGLGGFGGMFPLPPEAREMEAPALVAGADGVGTKLLVARALGDYSTIGIDCVAMVVNDLLCCGATTLFFLDYLAVGKFDAAQADAILRGIEEGCAQAGCRLLGGETAELPGLFAEGDFDVAGFGVGLLDAKEALPAADIAAGDVVIGVASSGLHSNGFSLARRLFPEYETDAECARQLLTPTRIYNPTVAAVQAAGVGVKGITHITGGGIPGNFVRALPSGLVAEIDTESWERPAIYEELTSRATIEHAELFRTFNMGIGLCLIVAADEAEQTLTALHTADEKAWKIGSLRAAESDESSPAVVLD